MAELNSFSTGGGPGEGTPNFSSDLSPAPYTRADTPQQPTVMDGPNGRPASEGIPGPSQTPDLYSFLNDFSPDHVAQEPQAQPQQQPQAPAPQQPQQQPQQPAQQAQAPQPSAPVQQPPQPPEARPFSQMDVDLLPPGHSMDSHIGTITRNADGTLSVALNEEGQRVHNSLAAREFQTFGYFWGHDDPRAPKPPLIPGKPYLNAFTGKWNDGWDPSELDGGM